MPVCLLRIDIFYVRPALTSSLLSEDYIPDPAESDPAETFHISLPAQLKRCGIEAKLIISGQHEQWFCPDPGIEFFSC